MSSPASGEPFKLAVAIEHSGVLQRERSLLPLPALASPRAARSTRFLFLGVLRRVRYDGGRV
jgi:hypothetical protein